MLVAALLSGLLLRSGLRCHALVAAATLALSFVVMTAGRLLLAAAGGHGRDPAAELVLGLLVTCLALYAVTELFPVIAAYGFGAVAALVVGMRLVLRRRLDAASRVLRFGGLHARLMLRSVGRVRNATHSGRPVWADYFFHGGIISQFGDPRALGHGSIYFSGLSPATGPMENTDRVSSRLLRLPLWLGVDADVPDAIAREIEAL